MSADSQEENADTLTLYLSLTSAPSAPRVPLKIPKPTDSSSLTTPSDLRRLASEATSVPLTALKLIFRGRVISDKSEGDVVKDFKLEHESVIHVMGKPAAASASAASASSSTTSTTGSMPAGASVSLPSVNATAPSSAASSSPLSSALLAIRSNSPEVLTTALTTADKLFANIVSHPMEEKYRTIKKSNPAFHRRLGGVTGGNDLLLASGFVVEAGEGGAELYVLRPSAEAWPRLVAAVEEVKRALEEVSRSAETSSFVPPSSNAAAAAGGLPNILPGGMPSGGGMGSVGAMQNMLSNPEMLQNMMSNPMVQQMMRNDPRLANNPMLQQSIDALASNPDTIRQFSQLMNDPGMMENVSRMMQQQSGGGAAGVGGGGAVPDPFSNGPEAMRRQMEQFQQLSQQFGGASGTIGGSGSGATPSGQNGTGASSSSGGVVSGSGGSNAAGDSEMTEEEMIAEAIARSLRES